MGGFIKFVFGVAAILILLGILLPIILPVSMIGFSFTAGLVQGLINMFGANTMATIGLIILAIIVLIIAFKD